MADEHPTEIDDERRSSTAEAQDLIATGGHSYDGASAGAPQDLLTERPEIAVGGALVAGLLVGALVSRLGR